MGALFFFFDKLRFEVEALHCFGLRGLFMTPRLILMPPVRVMGRWV